MPSRASVLLVPAVKLLIAIPAWLVPCKLATVRPRPVVTVPVVVLLSPYLWSRKLVVVLAEVS